MAAIIGGVVVKVLIIILIFMCLKTSINIFRFRIVNISKNKQWSGWTTFILGVPLFVIGLIMLIGFVNSIILFGFR